jgi:hypothetical protein
VLTRCISVPATVSVPQFLSDAVAVDEEHNPLGDWAAVQIFLILIGISSCLYEIPGLLYHGDVFFPEAVVNILCGT